jgi:hypothetical protein
VVLTSEAAPPDSKPQTRKLDTQEPPIGAPCIDVRDTLGDPAIMGRPAKNRHTDTTLRLERTLAPFREGVLTNARNAV